MHIKLALILTVISFTVSPAIIHSESIHSGTTSVSDFYADKDDPPSKEDIFIVKKQTLNEITVGISRKQEDINRVLTSIPAHTTVKPTIKIKTYSSSPTRVSYNQTITVIGTSTEQCVIYAKRITGIDKTMGYAGNTKAEGTVPKVGSIALERSLGHAMVVVALQPSGIIVHEANYIKGKIDSRFVTYSDIRGYLYK